jgi:putative oxidoreductase
MTDAKLAPYGMFLLRVSLGAMFVAHALKYWVFTMPGFAGFLGKVGLPSALAWPIFAAELIGGLAIIAGFYGRWVSLALLPVLVGALAVHWPTAGCSPPPTAAGNTPAFLTVAALTHVLAGDGAFAVRPARLPLISSPAVSPQTA